MPTIWRLAAVTTFIWFVIFEAASAAVLTVGYGKMYRQPAGAAAAAMAGDIIEIFPGTYYGAVWTKPGLVIEGMGGGATIVGPVKLGKGLFVIDGADITVKNLSFVGAIAGAGNGSGIRDENTGLVVQNSRFINNQDGILTVNDTSVTLAITGSSFSGNGACLPGKGCAHAIYAGHIASLTVTNSTITDTRKGHDIKSRANVTTITGNTITDGPNGTSSYLVDIPNGGTLTMTGNTLEKGPKSSNYAIAVSLGEEGATNPQGAMLIANNSFRNDGRPTVFVENRTGYAGLMLSGNVLSGNPTTPLVGKGTVSGPAAGMLRAAGSGGAAARFAAAAPFAVPEPWTLALFGAALLAIGMMRTGLNAPPRPWRRLPIRLRCATPDKSG
jgi:Right handed beta helix region